MFVKAVTTYFVERQSVSKHSYCLVIRGEGQIAAIQYPYTRNSIPANPSDHRRAPERARGAYHTPTKSIVTGVQKVCLYPAARSHPILSVRL